MHEDIRLGRIFGVRVGASASVFVIAALFTWSLAIDELPAVAPGRSSAAYWIAGACGALALLVSLLVHELAHAVVARRNGVVVEGITLWMLGGLTSMHREAATPGASARIAGVGPAASAALAEIYLAIALAIREIHLSALAAGLFAWLAAMNALLAVFNVLPALPLDGGRLLHALLWRRSGDARRATVQAAVVGRVFGLGLAYLGFVAALMVSVLGGLWLIFVGWFLASAAQAERQRSEDEASFGSLTCGDVMSGVVGAPLPSRSIVSRTLTVAPESPLRDVAPAVRAGALVLVADAHGRLVGLVTPVDLDRAAHHPPTAVAA